ncbi:MAG: hypothetical protein Q8M94_18430 [Ignavibacteria bacterium]|nr:hypothetical protein [Ignavibacteria bacterium]
MKISIWKIFAIFGIISAWSQAALADGKITLEEALSLIAQLAAALALPLEFDISKLLEK